MVVFSIPGYLPLALDGLILPRQKKFYPHGGSYFELFLRDEISSTSTYISNNGFHWFFPLYFHMGNKMARSPQELSSILSIPHHLNLYHLSFAVISRISGEDDSNPRRKGLMLPRNALLGRCIFMVVVCREFQHMSIPPGFPVFILVLVAATRYC